MSIPTIAVVGSGAVARAVLQAHHSAGGTVAAVVSRDAARARALADLVGGIATTALDAVGDAEVVIVAVSDRAVPSVGERLLSLDPIPASAFLHTSGALSGAAMAGPPVRTGSLHPLQSFPRPAQGTADVSAFLGARMTGAHWFHEGAAAGLSRALVEAWGGTFHALAPGSKALYHAGAAILSNHTVALFAAATRLFAAAGVEGAESRAPLARLLAGTSENLAAIGAPSALTGPIARGDVATVETHVSALSSAAPDLVPSYVELARLAVDVALAKGSIDETAAAALRAVLVV